ncbi:MAG: D-glycero-beta-D-manno-heptose 1-phosphate adenylyltransferase [Dehalococcoidia bacterium]
MNGKLLSLEDAEARCRTIQAQGRRVVLTNGCFDLLHVGHVRYLRKARGLGDALVVALNSDASARALKGPARPIVREEERAEVVAALASVDYVTVFDDATAEGVVSALRPDIYVKGGDYDTDRRDLPEAGVVRGYGGTVFLLELEPGTGTTEIIRTVVRRYRDGLFSWPRTALPPVRDAVAGG